MSRCKSSCKTCHLEVNYIFIATKGKMGICWYYKYIFFSRKCVAYQPYQFISLNFALDTRAQIGKGLVMEYACDVVRVLGYNQALTTLWVLYDTRELNNGQ